LSRKYDILSVLQPHRPPQPVTYIAVSLIYSSPSIARLTGAGRLGWEEHQYIGEKKTDSSKIEGLESQAKKHLQTFGRKSLRKRDDLRDVGTNQF
jgi:hypothetical protein